jgi:4-diphosphocytidyl-2-C-methyl-D-erythritol kinase
MKLFPNAKINIGLHVTEKRSDGYHNIETVFYPLMLSDELSVELCECSVNAQDKPDYLFQMSGINFDSDPEKNLVIKAFRLLQQEFELKPVNIYLRKNIPFGAGLGGGSSDAAFMLKALNQLLDLDLSDHKLEKLAVRLGADCPVFIKNKPVFANGIGDVFTPIALTLKGYYIVLVKPDILVPTPDAYASVVPKQPINSLLEEIRKPVATWKHAIKNDFESTVFNKYPLIAKIKSQLYEQGALYASMSGSGASVFGFFEENPTHLKGFESYFSHIELLK